MPLLNRVPVIVQPNYKQGIELHESIFPKFKLFAHLGQVPAVFYFFISKPLQGVKDVTAKVV